MRSKTPYLVLLAGVAWGLPAWGVAAEPLLVLARLLALAVAALGLGIFVGWAGGVSLAQAAMMGVGAYCTAWLMGAGWPLLLAASAGAVAAAGLALPVGLAVRRGSLALAVVTLGLAEAIVSVLGGIDGGSLAGGPLLEMPLLGLGPVVFSGPEAAYRGALAALLALVAWAWIWHRSPWGRLLPGPGSLFDGRGLAGTSWRSVWITFVLSCAFGALGGALEVYASGSPVGGGYGLERLALLLAAVIIGGPGSLVGSIAAAVGLGLLPLVVPSVAPYQAVMYGLLLAVALLYCPQGVASLRPFRWVSARVQGGRPR
ncbi:MAG: branched-chain amino acid ABC transporter permease [Chloroflexi bacterium]|nr:branched-chain amino acid ABC transporter permease [Chloroflexota bacterium]